MKNYYSSGKLLLTGEYVVLDGALALAVPTKFGQNLVVEEIEEQKIIWKSLDKEESIWFEDSFSDHEITSGFLNPRNDISNRLLEILQVAKQLNLEFLSTKKGYKATTLLEFPKNWGLGTSSTLINNIANWANVDAYQLLEKTFGGSGYDIACAQHTSAITYQLNSHEILNQVQDNKKAKNRVIKQVAFNPVFKEHLYFVHLNQKQNSRDGIAQYKKNKTNINEVITVINKITESIIICKTINEFNTLLDNHEQVISKTINLKPVKEVLFKDFKGSIKSLGAWGGDFILVSSKINPVDYFKKKGYSTILGYDEMVAS